MPVTYSTSKRHTRSSLNWNLSQNKEWNAKTNYISSKQLSDVLVKRQSSKRNVQIDKYSGDFCSFISYDNYISLWKCELQCHYWKTDAYAKCQCSLFQDIEFEWSTRMMGWSKSGQAKPSQAVVVSMHLRYFGLETNVLDIFVSIMCM